MCLCCGAEFGYEDCQPAGVQRYRRQWLESGGRWLVAETVPAGWSLEDQLRRIPAAYRGEHSESLDLLVSGGVYLQPDWAALGYRSGNTTTEGPPRETGGDDMPSGEAEIQQALLVHLTLSGGPFGSDDEVASIAELEERIVAALSEGGVGEFDGDEFGEFQCRLFMYGPSADVMADIVLPIIASAGLRMAGYALKRYGGADDASAREVSVGWQAS